MRINPHLNFLQLLLVCQSSLTAMTQAATEPGNTVVVVYNAALPESRQVAEHYAQARQVPANQVWGFELPASETISRADYLNQLEKPLQARLEAEKLFAFKSAADSKRHLVEAKIRYLALCYGVPTKIVSDPGLNEEKASQLRPELRRNEASVDSQLACLPLDPSDYLWAGPHPNPHYGATNAARLNPTQGILLVTRLDGPTAAIAEGLVDKAIQAEQDGLWGRAYFDLGWGLNNSNYLSGDRQIFEAAQLCRHLGFETVLDTNRHTFPADYPLYQTAFYAGWYAGRADGPFAWNGVEFMPGAFAYHLHSFSASTIRSTNQNWVGPLLAHGATATMGSVYEPYLSGTPDMNAFFSRFLFLGFSFGEAAWACQPVVSWQNIAVGDPFYRPFAVRPSKRAEELEKRQSSLLNWYFLMVINMNLAREASLGKAINALEKLPALRQSAILQEKLAGLYWAEKKLYYGLAAGEEALKLKPTRLQKLGLMLAQTERLTVYGRSQPALDLYQDLLREYPDFPNTLAIYEKMLPLARRLENQELIQKYEREIARLKPAGDQTQ